MSAAAPIWELSGLAQKKRDEQRLRGLFCCFVTVNANIVHGGSEMHINGLTDDKGDWWKNFSAIRSTRERNLLKTLEL